MQFCTVDRKLTSMKVQDLDKSSFIDYLSQVALKHPKNTSNSKNKESIFKEKQSVISKNEEGSIKNSTFTEKKVTSPHSVNENKYFLSTKNGEMQRSEFVAKRKAEVLVEESKP